MIRYLRQIRRQLMRGGQIRKYLLYAVGEILLVVVGILLALQVNNWNEERQLRAEERTALSELQADLRTNVRRLDNCLAYDRSVVRSLDMILDHLDNELPYELQLESHFPLIIEWCAYDYVDSAYENLKFTHGLDLVSNDSLREELIYVHESLSPFATGNVDGDEATLNQEITLPLFTELFSLSSDLESATPLDYKALFENEKLKTVLRITKARRLWSIETDEELKERSAHLIEQIGDILGNR